MENQSAIEGCGSSVCEEGGTGWLTSTPQPLRRALVELNTSSQRPQLTPYKYHGCRAIPEEGEDQENVDPALRGQTKGTNHSDTNHSSDSSPFAYPLIWESSHASSATTHTSPSDGKQSSKMSDLSNWRSPISHLDQDAASEGKGRGSGKAGKVRNRSGSEVGSKVACYGPSITPSKSLTQTVNASVFLTPSSGMQSTHKEEGRNGQTPKQQSVTVSTSQTINPFDVGTESLYLSAVSPSLFQRVVSPSQDVGGAFRWSIDQLAELYPVNIETSPFTQYDVMNDPEYERRAQDAIDRFFATHQSVIPSPWTSSNKSVRVVKKMCMQTHASPSLPSPPSQSVWCQTELSLPPVLPPAVEEALKPFCTFTQNQWCQGGTETEDAASQNNTTLPRKLLFSHEDTDNPMPQCPSVDSPQREALQDREPSHTDRQNEETEEGLAWCTEAVRSDGTSLMRHLPPTPPLACGAVTPSTTMQCAIRRGPSPLLFSADDDVSTPVSPDMSPIRPLDYSSDTEAKQHSQSPGGGYEHQKTHLVSPLGLSQASSQPPSQSPSYSRQMPSPRQSQIEKGEEMQSDHKEDNPVNITESFCVEYSLQFSGKEKVKSPACSPDQKSSSNSGHFSSSSPIRDITHSLLDVDSPVRFSSSLPLSPILYRTSHIPSARQTSVMLRKERKTTVEVTMMEEGEVGAPPPIGTFQQTSSLYDVEMDSQPSLESNFEETASQDTGYQTISGLLTSNFSSANFSQEPTSGLLLETTTSGKQLPSSARSKDFRL